MLGKSLLENLAVPRRHRNPIFVGGDPIPEGLHVVDLLVHGQVVEASGRILERVRHDDNVP